MADLLLTQRDGCVVRHKITPGEFAVILYDRDIVAVSDNIAQLTRVRKLELDSNALPLIPPGVFGMCRLTYLNLTNNALTTIPAEIGRLTALKELYVGDNAIEAVPRELGELRALQTLGLNNNALAMVPSELGQLDSLVLLALDSNRLSWLPIALDRLPATTMILAARNLLPITLVENVVNGEHSRHRLREIFAATTALAMLREEATTLAIGLADLDLPALVALEIIDAAWDNDIRMHAKWELVTAVKHFHQRRGL